MPDIFVSPRHRPVPDQNQGLSDEASPPVAPQVRVTRDVRVSESIQLEFAQPVPEAEVIEPLPSVTEGVMVEEPTAAPSPVEPVLYNEGTVPSTSTAPRRHVDEYSTILAATPPTSNPLASFAAKPVGTSFDSQIEGEHVLLLLRQHLVTQWKVALTVIFLIFVPFLVSILPIYGVIPTKFSILGTILWYLFVVSFVLEMFLNWFYNVYIITDERVVDVDFNSLLYKNISSAQLENVEDITSTTAGALGALFNFGDIQIQTSAAVTQFDFKAVPQPERVTAFLNELLVEEKQEELEGRVR